jgi:hypothetical protein
MLKNKYNKILKYSFLIFIYATIFFFILFGLPKYTFAQIGDRDLKIISDVKEGNKAEKEEKKEEEKAEKKEEKEEKKENKEEKKDNKKPHARMEYVLLETNIVYFDGSKSFDIDGTIISYSWNFGDGSAGSDITAKHVYNEPGKYRVVLTVIDDGGLQSTCDKNVNIKDNKYIYSFDDLLNNEGQTGEFKNLDNNSAIFNGGLANLKKEPNVILFKFNQLLEKLLNIRKDEITENLGINVNRLEDLINIEKIIENHNIIAVIDIDEIIATKLEKEESEDMVNASTKKAPESIMNIWNKFKDLVVFYN